LGGNAEALEEQPLGFRFFFVATRRRRKGEREKRKGRSFFLGSAQGEPERAQGPREQEVSPQTKPLGSRKARLLLWGQAAEARYVGFRVFILSARAEGFTGNRRLITKEEKSSEG
jgi:hypothetical protein